MICPMKFNNHTPEEKECKCEEEMCAWWDKEHNCCSILTIANYSS